MAGNRIVYPAGADVLFRPDHPDPSLISLVVPDEFVDDGTDDRSDEQRCF